MLWEGQRETPELTGVAWVAGWGGCHDSVVVSTLMASPTVVMTVVLTMVETTTVEAARVETTGPPWCPPWWSLPWWFQQWWSPQLRPPGSPHDLHLVLHAAIYTTMVSTLVGLTAVVSMLWQSPPQESCGQQGKGAWAG